MPWVCGFSLRQDPKHYYRLEAFPYMKVRLPIQIPLSVGRTVLHAFIQLI